MKVYIFKNEKGWSLSAKNYKDEKDIAYLNIRFMNCPEPTGEEKVTPNGKHYTFAFIDILEGSFGCYKGKLNLTVWSWQKGEKPVHVKEGFVASQEEIENQNELENTTKLDIKTDDLPFY